MTYTPIPKGQTNWDAPVNAAFTDQDSRITANDNSIAILASSVTELENTRPTEPQPTDQGWISWNFDPSLGQSGNSLTAGTVYMMKIHLRGDETISSLGAVFTTAGSGLANCYAGLYNQSGSLLSATADQSAVWNSIGYKGMALGAPQSLATGVYYVAFLANGTTPPASMRTGSPYGVAMNANLDATTYRWTTGPTGQTTLPSSIDMSARASTALSFWTSLS